MLEEAINLIKKELDMYKILDRNLTGSTNAILKAKRGYKKQIQLREYIFRILKEQKKWGGLWTKVYYIKLIQSERK